VSTVSQGSSNGRDGRAGLRAALSRSALRLQSDRRLVALTRGGSGAAFSVIVERYRAPLLTYCRRLLGPDEAEDALQQTFANALAALRRDDRDIDLRPWLYRISHNIAVNALRRRGRLTEQLDEQFDGVPQPPDVLEEKLRVERLVREIGELPERQRTAIVAHELEGRSYEEIADRMSATTPVVRQLVHRARTRLRDACGVLVPVWALRWLSLADLRGAGPEHVGEAVAGGAAGAGILKAGTALLATGAIATGAGGLVTQEHRRAADERQNGAQAHAAGALEADAPSVGPRAPHSSPPRSGVVPQGAEAADGVRRGPREEREPHSPDRSDDRDDGSHHERPRGDRGEREDHEGGGDSESEESHKASHEEPDSDEDEVAEESDSSGQGPSGAPDDSEGSDPSEDSSGPDAPPEAPEP
jgi:RNA polymerase sigma factor (sigma-70 family)